jgi:hypothetical protein
MFFMNVNSFVALSGEGLQIRIFHLITLSPSVPVPGISEGTMTHTEERLT